MNKYDLVKLLNDTLYLINNLKKNMHGIVVGGNSKFVDVLFFNPHNLGDYAIVNVNANDLIVEKEKLPDQIQKELSFKLNKILKNSKNTLVPVQINEYDEVELLVEKDIYTKHGIHKGDRGCVMDNEAVQDYIEVDFSGVDENGNFYGECISVKMEDLKVIK